MYSVGRAPYKMLDIDKKYSKPRRINLTLHGRGDLVKYF